MLSFQFSSRTEKVTSRAENPSARASSSYGSSQLGSGSSLVNKLPWWFVHDVQVRGVEPEGGGGQAIGDQVDPQKLYGNQSFGQT